MTILAPNNDNISLCAKALLNQELVAFPTETVYGLGADARSDTAIKKIFALKGRPSNNPLIVHYASFDSIMSDFSDILNKDQTEKLIKLSALLPGPLSIILPKIDKISGIATAGSNTVAVRVPKNNIASLLLASANIPIAAPSANKSLLLSPTSAKHVSESFNSPDLKILDGGECNIGIESTVLDITTEFPTVLRPGYISHEQISEILGIEVKLISGNNSEILKSPGQLKVHYSPTKPLVFLDQLEGENYNPKLTAVILISKEKFKDFKDKFFKVYVLSDSSDSEEIAKKLYSTLREAEKLPVELLAIEKCEEKGLGFAIMDRLKRATAKLD